jgi:hypothetical protein
VLALSLGPDGYGRSLQAFENLRDAGLRIPSLDRGSCIGTSGSPLSRIYRHVYYYTHTESFSDPATSFIRTAAEATDDYGLPLHVQHLQS